MDVNTYTETRRLAMCMGRVGPYLNILPVVHVAHVSDQPSGCSGRGVWKFGEADSSHGYLTCFLFFSCSDRSRSTRDTKTAISCCRMQERRLLTWAERNSSVSIGLGVSSGLVGMWCEYSQDGSCGRKLTQREVQASLRFDSASRVGVFKLYL